MKEIIIAATEAAQTIKGFAWETISPKYKCTPFFEGIITEEIMNSVYSVLHAEGFHLNFFDDSDFSGFVSRKARLWVSGTGCKPLPYYKWGWAEISED